MVGCVFELEELDEQAVADKTRVIREIHGLALNIFRGYMKAWFTTGGLKYLISTLQGFDTVCLAVNV
jgi:hypothetical protein